MQAHTLEFLLAAGNKYPNSRVYLHCVLLLCSHYLGHNYRQQSPSSNLHIFDTGRSKNVQQLQLLYKDRVAHPPSYSLRVDTVDQSLT